eukprot:CAMPEP_0185199396 /NCGR_PEP_ID=MMETSP1140-20130426/45020_1 /TAXON_ID=298111 /ORGANISM="Pavlova sp., Strain CCMP459" /LENGTH=101 /DNA_ID=CAMNT_0027766667 /DNA_START=289 /DNA_END=590 /DNA_ORIENTATION=+
MALACARTRGGSSASSLHHRATEARPVLALDLAAPLGSARRGNVVRRVWVTCRDCCLPRSHLWPLSGGCVRANPLGRVHVPHGPSRLLAIGGVRARELEAV